MRTTAKSLIYKYLPIDYLIAMQAKQAVKEVWRVQASGNVSDHNILCAVEDCVISATSATVKNSNPLPNFDEYTEL